MAEHGLSYTGGGHGGSLPGIPARDLSAEEVQRYGGAKALVKSGLYIETKKLPGGSENKAQTQEETNP